MAVRTFEPANPTPYSGTGTHDGDFVVGTAPDSQYWDVLGLAATLVTSAVVGNRTPSILIFSKSGKIILQGAGGAVTAGKTVHIALYPPNGTVEGIPIIGFPLRVPPGGSIVVRLAGGDSVYSSQAGDALSGGFLMVEESPAR